VEEEDLMTTLERSRTRRPAFPAIAKTQFLIARRTPALLGATIALPVLLYLVLGTSNRNATVHGVPWTAYSLAGLGAYSAGSIMVFNFGVSLAMERGRKVDVLFRASPMRPASYFLAKTLVALTVAAVALVFLAAVALLVNRHGLSAAIVANLLVRLLLGSIPFLALGMLIGYLAGPDAASAVASLSYLLLSFCSGLFIPLSQLPHGVRDVARFLPTYHFAQLAWGALGASDETTAASIGWLLGWTVFFFGAAYRRYARDQARRFG
jgi:ABC-2 type transport system permease protein